MVKTTITWRGMNTFHQRVALMDPRVRAKVMEELTRTSILVHEEAVRIVPVDTGRLKNSIQFRSDPAQLLARVLTNVVYAPYVEYGTHRAAAQPYMGPAAKKVEADHWKRIAAAFKGGVEGQ